MSEQSNIKIDVRLNKEAFQRFTVFDGLLRQYRYLTVCGFLLVSLLFTLLDFISGARLLGWVILIIAFVLASTWCLSFYLSLRQELKNKQLDGMHLVYSLTLSDSKNGIHIENDKGEQADYAWEDCFGVYRVDDAHYLYMRQNRAFLLPDAALINTAPDTLWALAEKMLPDGKRHERRGKWRYLPRPRTKK